MKGDKMTDWMTRGCARTCRGDNGKLLIAEVEPPGLQGLGEAEVEEEEAAGGGLGDRDEGDLGLRAPEACWVGEVEVAACGAGGWVGLAVREELSQGERGSRLNQWPLFSVSTRKSWSLGRRAWG